MFRNIITTTFRHFYKNKGYSLTNIFGLAIGLATCLIIFLYVQDELSYDRFFSNAESIYRLEPRWVGQGEDSHWAASSGNVLPGIVASYPEIKSSVKIHRPYNPPIFKSGEKRFTENNVLFADSGFFEVFDFKILRGDPKKMLKGRAKLVLTETTAKKYFGSENPMGKLLKIDTVSFLVSGLVEDIPRNSHLSFDLLISLDHIRSQWDGVDQDGPSTFYSYVTFDNVKVAQEVAQKYSDNIYTHLGMVVAGDSSNMPDDYEAFMIFNPITNIHLNGHAEKELSINSDKQYVIIFSAVALFVLIIACFNYMNLATAKSTRRSREVGLRRVMGATRQNIFNQFISESFSLALVSMLIALGITDLVLPDFNQFAGKQLELELFGNLPLLGLILGIIVVVGFLSGTYPSVFMSKLSPIKTLKSNSLSGDGTRSSLTLRRILVLAQFTISIFLIIGILMVNKQLNFIQNKKLGFDKEHVVVLRIPDRAATEKMEVMKNELLQLGDIIHVAASSNIPGDRVPFLTVRLPGEDDDGNSEAEGEEDGIFGMRTWTTGFDFIETLGLEIAEGRSFSKDFGTDEENAFILNEAAVADFELEDPIGHDFEYLYGLPEPKRGKIIGVVKDFHYASLHHEVEPLLIHVAPYFLRYMLVKIKGRDIKNTLSDIDKVWVDHIPYLPMNAFFLDSSYDNLYKTEMNTGTILGIFTLLAIIIAMLGLFGLASFVTEQRTKEIGIRRVLGASIYEIIGKLSFEFILLVCLANILAWAPAYLFLQEWMSTFEFRTSISIWLFAVSALISIGIAISTVGIKAWIAAKASPVQSLKAD